MIFVQPCMTTLMTAVIFSLLVDPK